jgi:hypothetical protein
MDILSQHGMFNPSNITNISSIPTFSGGITGSEGGEFHIAKPASGTNLTSDVIVDVSGNIVRTFATYNGVTREVQLNLGNVLDGVSEVVTKQGVTLNSMIQSKPSTGAMNVNTQGTPGLEVASTPGVTTDAAYMTFHRQGSFAARFGLDTDNNLKIGGWSMGNVAYKIYHEGNLGSWNLGATAPTAVTRVNCEGYLYATRVYNAVYNDYAEYFEKGEALEPGDVVMIDTESDEEVYIKSNSAYCKFVVGVVSDEYGQCLGGKGDGNDEENFSPIGMAGRVRVKLTGAVSKGDLLVASSIPGVAMVADPSKNIEGAIIGKALENYDGSNGIKRIKALILNR